MCTIDRNVLAVILYVWRFVILKNYVFQHCKTFTFVWFSIRAFPAISSPAALCHIFLSRIFSRPLSVPILCFSVDRAWVALSSGWLTTADVCHFDRHQPTTKVSETAPCWQIVRPTVNRWTADLDAINQPPQHYRPWRIQEGRDPGGWGYGIKF